jgi:hypothetical protein
MASSDSLVGKELSMLLLLFIGTVPLKFRENAITRLHKNCFSSANVNNIAILWYLYKSIDHWFGIQPEGTTGIIWLNPTLLATQ